MRTALIVGLGLAAVALMYFWWLPTLLSFVIAAAVVLWWNWGDRYSETLEVLLPAFATTKLDELREKPRLCDHLANQHRIVQAAERQIIEQSRRYRRGW
jgi:hypothetical protein